MILYFWWLRLDNDQVIRAAQSQTTNPIRAIGRFMVQPCLRIAYLITLSRACFWVTVFIYGPIYIVEAGLPAWWSGLLLSGVSSLLFFSPAVRRLADHFGTRQVLIACSILIGVMMVMLGLVGEAKPIGILFIVLGSFGGAGDGCVGQYPFFAYGETA